MTTSRLTAPSMNALASERLRESADPAIRRLAGDRSADALSSARVRKLLEFPKMHPYSKFAGTHWRLVALADLGVPPRTKAVAVGIEQELAWLACGSRLQRAPGAGGLVRVHASQEGNAIYAGARLGFATDPRVRKLVDALLEWQWPDGGWNCGVNASGRRSSFHETVTPALGLAAYHAALGHRASLAAARRAAELLLEHRLYRALRSGEVIHPSWTKPHYPPYWHYDIVQGLRLLQAVGRLGDRRADDALDLLERRRGRDGRFSGPSWNTAMQPDAVEWGRGADNEMLNLRIEGLLQAARASRR